ncbi:hypothetical protein WR25_14808 [Diploscapter pachys]|uniref:Uncharacterized protein n=1 Tax=Diploscapter pachys TaxID=2018661 RepID=A0A2A2JB10_9BILA|nr:hypothetical protein WR25_14808 [Diploscapter pachys]
MTEMEGGQVQMQRGQMSVEVQLRDWMRRAEQATGIQTNILIVTLVILLAAILESVNLECRQLIVNGLLLFYLCLLVLPHRQSPLSNSVIGFSLLLFLSILSDRFFESSIPFYYLLKLLLFLYLLLPPMTHLRKFGKAVNNMADNSVRSEPTERTAVDGLQTPMPAAETPAEMKTGRSRTASVHTSTAKSPEHTETAEKDGKGVYRKVIVINEEIIVSPSGREQKVVRKKEVQKTPLE